MNAVRVLVRAALLGAVAQAALVRADPALGDKLGTIRFEVTARGEARDHVVRGVKLLHHMMYPEADREFAQAAALEPGCALAYWGRAMTLLHPLWPDVPGEADRAQGRELIRRGLAVPPATPRERQYLEALGAYFVEGPADHPTRLRALDEAWSALAERFPDDLDAVAFGALFHLAPARFAAKDRSHRIQLEAAASLQKVSTAIPDHPGAQHYRIHALDFPLLADRALEVCDSYGGIAPDVPHALHMPTHIYTRRGQWEKSIEFNRRSAAAARQLGEKAGSLNGHLPHALDYLAYAYLQRGQYAEAEAVRRQIAGFTGPYSSVQMTSMAFAFAAVPARCALERREWREAAALPLRSPAAFTWGPGYAYCDAITHFARAIGGARSGQPAVARTALAELERIRADLISAHQAGYWIAQAETQRLAVQGWLVRLEKRDDEAVALLRKAAEIEASTDKEAVTPGEVVPAGELLGDLLLELKRPTDALTAYEAVLAASPNRLATLFGAGSASEQAGDAAKARQFFQQLLAVTEAADAGNPRLEHAKAFLARKNVGATGQ